MTADKIHKATGEIVPAVSHTALAESRQKFALMADNLGGRKVDPSLLPRVGFPTGGGRAWEIPKADGTHYSEIMHMVVLASSPARAYWPDEVGEGDKFPVCTSSDGFIGIGIRWDGDKDEEHHCDDCPLSKWGSVEGSRRQACREFRALLGLVLPTASPVRVRIPPSSIRRWDEYAVRIAGEGYNVFDVVTRIGLETQLSMGDKQVEYSKADFAMAEHLDPETRQSLSQTRQLLGGAMTSFVTMDDVAPEEAKAG